MAFLNMLISAVIQLLVFSFIPFIWWLITARKKCSFMKWIGLKKPQLTISLVKLAIIVFAVTTLYVLIMMGVVEKVMSGAATATRQFANNGIAALPQILVYAVIQTSLSEEIFFRGFLCKRFTDKFGFKIGNLMQALLFGLIHGIPFGLATGNVLVFLLLVLLPGAIGWIMGWMNEKCSSGSIVPGWILHACMNILSGLATALS